MKFFVDKNPLTQLKDGGLVIMYDDLITKNGTLIGLGEYVTSEKVNFMIKVGKGLTYVCITEERAEQLEIPKMIKNNDSDKKNLLPFQLTLLTQQLEYQVMNGQIRLKP
jgi:3,4-dihydroxy-2-butanone 4-phosphate synthase